MAGGDGIKQIQHTAFILLRERPSRTHELGQCATRAPQRLPGRLLHQQVLHTDRVGGSVIDWVMKAEGVSFRHAVELLRTQGSGTGEQGAVPPSPPSTNARIVKRTRVPKLSVPLPAEADAQHWADVVMEEYHATLQDRGPEGKAYLAKRGLLNDELIATFKLGVANRTLGYRLPRMETSEGAVIRGTLQQLGYLRPSGHEHFRGCLTVPILNEDGHVTGMYGTANALQGWRKPRSWAR